MIIPMDKLHDYKGNKYIFTRSAMLAVEKIGNIKDYPEGDFSWKVIPNILKLCLNKDINFLYRVEDNLE